MMNQDLNLNDKTIDMIRFRIIDLEKKNAKSHEKKDADMIKEIVDIIKEEVNREN